MILNDLLKYAEDSLDPENFNESQEEIVRIVYDVFGMERYEIILNKTHAVTQSQERKFKNIILERKKGRPLAHILGYSYFYKDRFPVSDKTLIPRYDTELLVETVRKHGIDSNSILDICTGTGAIALSLHRVFPDKKILGVDIVDGPFEVSKKSLQINSNNICFQQIDFLDRSTWKGLGLWDCIVSNPPYLDDDDMNRLDVHVKDFEPHLALYANNGGMEFYQAIQEFSKKHLNPSGIIVLETDHKYQMVLDLFDIDTYPERTLLNDYGDLPRAILLKKHP